MCRQIYRCEQTDSANVLTLHSFRIQLILFSSCFCVSHWVPTILCAFLVPYVRVRYTFHVIFPYTII